MEIQLKWDQPAFLKGALLGVLGYIGASRVQRILLVRRPWHFMGSVLVMGMVGLGVGNYQEAATKALSRQKKLYVQRLREQTEGEGTQAISSNSRELYEEIVRELERKGEIVNGELVQEVYIGQKRP